MPEAERSQYSPRHAITPPAKRREHLRIKYFRLSANSARRAGVTAVDQGVASLSNFGVGAVVGHATGPEGLGAFALAYTLWILLINLHRSLITDPMAILGDARADATEIRDRVRTGLAAEVVLAVAASALLATGGAVLIGTGHVTFGDGLLAFAPWTLVLNMQDFWRWMGFLLGQPEKSLVNDVVFNVVQGIGFAIVLWCRWTSVFVVVAAWGLGGAVSALWGLRQFGVRPTLRNGVGLLRKRWSVSRWLVGASMVGWASSSVSSVVVASVLGASALGGLKAAGTLAWGPLAVVMQAGTSFGLPEATRMLAEHGLGGLRKVSMTISGLAALVAAVSGTVILVAGGTLLSVLYGNAFRQYWVEAMLIAAAFLAGSLALGPSLSLKALARVRVLFALQGGTAVLSLGVTIVLASTWGVEGAAEATLITAVGSLGAVTMLLRSARKASGATSNH